LKEPFSPFINVAGAPVGVIISPAALQKYGKDIAFNPVGTGPFVFRVEADRLREGQEIRRLLEEGLPQG
jgi:ABC-type transport system substrate-binding protein